MEYICVFEYIGTLHFFLQIYYNLPLYEMKWNSFFSNILPRLYFYIMCKNIIKFFQMFDVGYTQTYTLMESNIMSHPKRVSVVCFHPFMWAIHQVGNSLHMFKDFLQWGLFTKTYTYSLVNIFTIKKTYKFICDIGFLYKMLIQIMTKK